MKKNTASQKWIVFAFDRTDNAAKTADAGNITAKISKDGAAGGATNDVNPTELESGYYVFDLTQAETDADVVSIIPVSATANIQVIGVPGTVYTNASTDQTGDSYVRLGAPTGASVSADIATIDGNVDSILVDTSTTIPGTITTIDNEIAVIDGIVDTILLDTAELQTDWTNGGRLDLLLDAVKAKTDNLPGAIPKAVALADFAFVMYSSTDHVTPMTGLTVSGTISKDGGAFAALDGTIAAISSGVYQVDSITATEMDADLIVLRFAATGADDVVIVIKTDT